MPRHIGTCFRFYTQMRVEKKKKHLPIKFIVTSHNSVYYKCYSIQIKTHVIMDELYWSGIAIRTFYVKKCYQSNLLARL